MFAGAASLGMMLCSLSCGGWHCVVALGWQVSRGWVLLVVSGADCFDCTCRGCRSGVTLSGPLRVVIPISAGEWEHVGDWRC